MKKKELGTVTTRYFTFDGLKLENGARFGPVKIAYETYGELNSAGSNAVLILHALSGDAHAAGFHEGAKKPGWWDALIGPGKAFDTDRYFVICSNVFGGCKGSTGPASIDPGTGRPYALAFPVITLWDMVRCQKELVESLGIKKLLCAAGGSMGGMQVLAWLAQFPDFLAGAIPIATAMKHSPQQIAFNEVGRQAIMADHYWKDGNYYGGPVPAKGLAVARMLGHITYMSDVSMAGKFGRQRKNPEKEFRFNAADFEVEGYLHYHGDNFVKRFDANSYLYITKAMDNFDASRGKEFHRTLERTKAKVLVIAFKSDWLYPAYQSKEIVRSCKLAGIDTSYCEVASSYGHDAFLLETEEETALIAHFLKKLYYEYEVTGKYGL